MRVTCRYLQSVKAVASDTFWRFFLDLHTESGVTIDAALSAAKSTFFHDSPASEIHGFVACKRTLLRRMSNIQPPFWPSVTHTIKFDLPAEYRYGRQKRYVFRFINPLWGWIVAAHRLRPEDLQWVPLVQTDRVSGERLYGGGVQYGKAFASAYRSCPIGTYPMALSLHWDGANAKGMHATPIAVGVANINKQPARAHFCIAYMPQLSGVGNEFLTTAKARQIRHYIRQKCIGAILTVLEEGARRGVRCTLDVDGRRTERTLYPRLMSMPLDQPEAQAYFGMRNATSCSKCRRRKGRIAHRHATRQRGVHIKILYNIVEDMTLENRMRRLASQKLIRWGFHPQRRCLLPVICRDLLVRVEGTDEVFPGVDMRDKLHGLFSFFSVVLTAFGKTCR